jgi:molecular chaperone GrpE (heat shock protein)
VNDHVATTERAAGPDGLPEPDTTDPTTSAETGGADPAVADAPDAHEDAAAPRGALSEAVDVLRDALAASLRTQEHQQALLDRLHEEKERLREAEQRRQRDPVLRDLIQLSDTCLRTSRQWRDRGDVSAETAQTVSAALADVAEDVALVLERQGIDSFLPAVEDPFLRSEANAVGTRPTNDADREGRVAEVRKTGYRMGERVLRFSEVVVWRFEPADEVPDEPRPGG